MHAAFLCEAKVNEHSITVFVSAQPNHCPLCQLAFPWDISKSHKILEHIATHILFDNTLDNTTEPCSFACADCLYVHFSYGKERGLGVHCRSTVIQPVSP